MTSVTSQTPEEVAIRVAGSSSAKDVAVAIGSALQTGSMPVLRAIGAGAVNQALKSIIIASAYQAQQGKTVFVRPGWEHVSLQPRRRGEPITAEESEMSVMLLRVIATPAF